MEKEKIKESLINYFEAEPEKKFTVQELADKLEMNKAGQFNFVVQAVAQLEHDKVIALNDEGLFSAVKHESASKFTGIFHANDRGFGFVTVDPEEPDYFINPTQTLSALNGDEVEVEMIAAGDPAIGKRPEGKVTGIVQRNLTQVVGEFKPLEDENVPSGIIGTVHLRDKKLSNYRFLVEDTGLHPVEGEIVLADITTYPSSDLPGIIKGVATKVIGNINDPGIDILQIVYQHDIPHKFPEDVMEQVAQIPDHVTPEQKVGRRDLTDEQMVTIDSIESKDLDDAVSVRKLDNGNYHLGVHIADVSHYVTPNTPLDREAFERGTSVYLTDRVIPMIPAKLSNGICSLNPQVERLALTCEMEIDPQGEVVSHEIFPSVIKTTERMTYKAINKILESDDQKEKERYRELVPMFEEMGESFMLAANETVAAHYKDLHVPFIYRIHETPKEEKIKSFFEMLSGLGVEVTGKVSDIQPKMLQKILKKVAGKPEEPMVSVMLLRSMQQAKYSPEPLGHFGLAAKDYTHFTSPIRRYPDLMVHRMIHYYAENGIGEGSQAKFQAELPEVSQHSSQAERRAIDAERDTDAMKKAEYMADHVGEEFDAVVSSVTKFGMFVELPNTVEGLIHISEINDDYYIFVEKQMALVGRKTKQTYRIGQPIRVKLVNVNAEQKEIDFKLLSLGKAPKSDLLEGVELPEMPPKRKFDRKNGDKRGQKRPFKRQNNNNGRRDNRHNSQRSNNQNGRKPFYKKRRDKK